MKVLQIIFVFAAIEVTFQQSLRCFRCRNCQNTDQSLWERPSCETGIDDGPVGSPTPPPLPLGFSAKNITLESNIEAATNFTEITSFAPPVVTNAQVSHVCFLIVTESFGSVQVERGCTVRQNDHDSTCRTVANQWRECHLCDRDFCNENGSAQLAYSFMLIAAFYVVWNILS